MKVICAKLKPQVNFLFVIVLFSLVVFSLLAVDIKNIKRYYYVEAIAAHDTSYYVETNVNVQQAIEDINRYETLLFIIKKEFYLNSFDVILLIVILSIYLILFLIKFKKRKLKELVFLALKATLNNQTLVVLSLLCLFIGVVGGINIAEVMQQFNIKM